MVGEFVMTKAMNDIIIERVHVDLMGGNINTCNYSKDPNDSEVTELDYETELKKTNLMNYANLIDYPISWIYTFTEEEIHVLIKYASDYLKNNIDEVEIKPVLQRLDNAWTKGAWFFRFNSMSPKDGIPNCSVTSALDTINKIITSKRAWNCMTSGEKTIYFVRYENDWDPKREFRVFIYKRKVTAISQYNIGTKSMLSGKSNHDVMTLTNGIKDHLEKQILPLVCPKIGTDNVTCDLYINRNGTIRIVEFNSFGYWQAAGSALFEWIGDKNKLYNQDGKIYVRFVK